jgi:hypothetical protein
MVRIIKNTFQHSFGKFRRLYLYTFKKNYVKKMVSIRKGECRQCGACCKLLYKCPFLIEKDGLFSCKIYGKIRPINCIIFPINEKDIKDRNTVLPDIPCGYFFENQKKTNQ